MLDVKKVLAKLLGAHTDAYITRTYTLGGVNAYYKSDTVDIGVNGYTPISVTAQSNQAAVHLFNLSWTNTTLSIGRCTWNSSAMLTQNTQTIVVRYIKNELVGGVLRKSVISTLSAISKIGGGVNVRPQKTDREDSGVAERSDCLSGVHSLGLDHARGTRLGKQERSVDGSDRIYGSLLGESKTERGGHSGISGQRRNIGHIGEHHGVASKHINRITDYILCDDRNALYKGRVTISERGWAAC